VNETLALLVETKSAHAISTKLAKPSLYVTPPMSCHFTHLSSPQRLLEVAFSVKTTKQWLTHV